jgi:hypothetical protein
MSDLDLEIGKEYVINHREKGRFQAELLGDNGEWLLIRITLPKSQAKKIISVKKSFCKITKVEEE